MYPGYVAAIVASIVTGVPVKWIDQVLDVALEAKPVPLSEEEVAAAVGFLAMGPSSSITGINLPVDGGRTPVL